jgi:hypothetical protein
MASQGLQGNGGITAHYIPSINNKSNVTTFKHGFRMLVGDAALQSPSTVHKVCHRCMPKSGDNSNINCGSPDAQTLPTGICAGGIRSIISFPTCWDGKNLDIPDHESHVTYGTGSASNDVGPTGTCPSSHPVVLPQVMYEAMWDVSVYLYHFIYPVFLLGHYIKSIYLLTQCVPQTRPFNSKDLWPTDGSQPFFWSTGDK